MLLRAASRRGYDDLVIAGFTFDGAAQAAIEDATHPHVRIHMAHIRSDVNPGMTGLLKEQPGSQLFTVFGQPRTRLDGPDGNGDYTVVMEGVDIYNPVDNSVTPTRADKVAAWFIDGDYDGRTFCGSRRGTPGNTTLGRYGYGPRVQPAVAFRRRDAGAWIAPRRSGRPPRRVEGFYSQEDASLREIVAAFEQETGKQVEVAST